jgi:hypothetical protein
VSRCGYVPGPNRNGEKLRKNDDCHAPRTVAGRCLSLTVGARNRARGPHVPGRVEYFLNALQWPAMVVTLTAAWLVASQSMRKRTFGFWCFVASNILWIAWGVHAQAYALIALQVGLFVLNLRGVRKNDPQMQATAER